MLFNSLRLFVYYGNPYIPISGEGFGPVCVDLLGASFRRVLSGVAFVRGSFLSILRRQLNDDGGGDAAADKSGGLRDR